MSLTYSSTQLANIQYQKDLVKKNEEIAELKAENEKLKDEDKCVMDMLEPAIKIEFSTQLAELKAKNDELESEVLDARESFNLQQQSDLFYCRGMIYCDAETGENMTKDGLMKLMRRSYIASKENAELKAKEKSNTGWLKLTQDNAELKAENEKWGCWASDVLYYSHSTSKDNLQAKNLITESNQPTFTKIRNFGEEIAELKAENYKLKEQFEVIEQSTESCAYMELEIERLQSAEYKQEILMENIDDAMGNWVDDVFGVCDLDEVKKQMDELKAENEKLKSDMSCMVDKERLSFRLGYGSLTEQFDWEKAVLGMRKDAERIEKLYTELTGKSPEVGGAIHLADMEEESKKVEEDTMSICAETGEEYDWPATHQLKDVKVGEGDVGWEKY